MPVINAESFVGFVTSEALGRNPATATITHEPYGPASYVANLKIAPSADSVTVTDNTPVNTTGEAVPAQAAYKFSDTFYNRILITPNLLQMGNILSTQDRDIEVWNGFLSSSKQLTALNKINISGLTITDPTGPLPYIMQPLESLDYTINISPTGPPAIAALYEWVISSETHSVSVLGSRVTNFLSNIDWSSDIVEVDKWATVVMEAADGSEQRTGVRYLPRLDLRYTYLMRDNFRAYMDNLIFGWQERMFSVPIWTDATRLTQDALIGDTVILVPTYGYAYQVGGFLMLSDGNGFELQEVVSLTPTSVTVGTGLDGNWGKNSTISPAGLARIGGGLTAQQQNITSDVSRMTIPWEFEPTTFPAYSPEDLALPDSYLSEEYYPNEPNWAKGLQTGFESNAAILDFETSGFKILSKRGYPHMVTAYEWLIEGRENITKFREFLNRRSGRMVPFWLPTWTRDFIVKLQIASSSSVITVENNGYTIMVEQDTARRDINIVLRDGTSLRRQITNSSETGGNIVLSINAPLGQVVEPEDIKIVSIIRYVRMNSDEVQITWKNLNVITARINFVGLRP